MLILTVFGTAKLLADGLSSRYSPILWFAHYNLGKAKNMKKLVWNVAFALVVLTILTPNAWCTLTGKNTPDAAATSTLLGIAVLGLPPRASFCVEPGLRATLVSKAH